MHSHMNRNENDDLSERFHILKTRQSPAFYEETITKVNMEEHIDLDDMGRTTWERTPVRRVNVISGPQSAFARLFPDRYRQEEEEKEFRNKQRSKSSEHRHANLDRMPAQYTISDDEDDEHQDQIRRSRRVRFFNEKDDSFQTRTKSEPYLHQMYSNNDLHYDPDPEIIYRDNPDDVTYTRKVGVRYLKPPTPPPPGPILIREVQSTPPNNPPPLVVSTTP